MEICLKFCRGIDVWICVSRGIEEEDEENAPHLVMKSSSIVSS